MTGRLEMITRCVMRGFSVPYAAIITTTILGISPVVVAAAATVVIC